MKTASIFVAVLLSAIVARAQDQTPVIFSVRIRVVAGAQRADTLYALAEGKWSDADDQLGGIVHRNTLLLPLWIL